MISKELTIAVLCGGSSQEREVSLRSGKNVLDSLLRQGYKAMVFDPSERPLSSLEADVAFLALHGPQYEDGAIQAQLELFGIPYTGNGPSSCIISMNKLFTKALCARYSIPTAAYVLCSAVCDRLPQSFSYPVVLKPLNEGSSIDVFICDTDADLVRISQQLLKRYSTFLLEEFIEGREITVGVVQCPDTVVLPSLELIPKNRFYDYEAKYTPGMTDFILPARLSEQEKRRVNELTITLFELFNCHGMARFDYRVCPKRGPLLLELNSIPGLTNTSDLPAQAKEYGLSFDGLIEHILNSAFTRML